MNQRQFETEMREAYIKTGLLFGKYKFDTLPDEPHVSRWIKQDGYWEGYVSAVIYRLFDKFKFKVCVDVGANTGYYSFLYNYLGAEKVYAFEPVTENYTVLLKNILQNNLEASIYAYQKAVADYTGETVIYTDNGLPNAHIFGGSNGVRVDVVSLDEFFGKEYFMPSGNLVTLAQPEFLKIDAEGAEYKIIMGAKWLLESNHLKALHIEMAINRGYSTEELFDYLSGYFPYSYDMLSGLPGGKAVQTRSFMDLLFTKRAFDVTNYV